MPYHVGKKVDIKRYPKMNGVGLLVSVDDNDYPISDEKGEEILRELYRYFETKKKLEEYEKKA